MDSHKFTCSREILCLRKPFLVKGTAWPRWKLQWDLPPNVIIEEVLARHSVPHLLERLEEQLPLQVIEHRGMYNLGKGIQECTETSLLTALGELGRHNLFELDATLTLDDLPVVCHEFNMWRISTMPDKLVRELHSADIKNAPVIIREVSNGEITNSYTITNDNIPFLEPLLDKVFSINPGATIFLDGRDFEAHIIVVWLSHHPKYHQHLVLLFYTFEYASGDAFVDVIMETSPVPEWQEIVALMPVIFPQELRRLVKLLQLGDIAMADLYTAGKAWIDSMLKQMVRIVAVHIVMAKVKPDQLGSCDDVIRAFNADYVAVRRAHYVKEEPAVRKSRPYLKLATATRCYDFSSKMANGEQAEFSINIRIGRAVRRKEDQRKYIHYGYGTSGNAAAMADWVILDCSEDDMALWEWHRQGINRDVDHYCPHLDTIEH